MLRRIAQGQGTLQMGPGRRQSSEPVQVCTKTIVREHAEPHILLALGKRQQL